MTRYVIFFFVCLLTGGNLTLVYRQIEDVFGFVFFFLWGQCWCDCMTCWPTLNFKTCTSVSCEGNGGCGLFFWSSFRRLLIKLCHVLKFKRISQSTCHIYKVKKKAFLIYVCFWNRERINLFSQLWFFCPHHAFLLSSVVADSKPTAQECESSDLIFSNSVQFTFFISFPSGC